MTEEEIFEEIIRQAALATASEMRFDDATLEAICKRINDLFMVNAKLIPLPLSYEDKRNRVLRAQLVFDNVITIDIPVLIRLTPKTTKYGKPLSRW